MKPTDPYKELASAIVYQAVLDYMEVSRPKGKHPDWVSKKKKRYEIREDIEDFFNSDDCDMLSDIKGSEILDKIKEQYIDVRRIG